jgi:WD40 repeat protein
MGEVWMAEQAQPVQRKVALKLIKPGMDTKQVVARFEAERQALALMDHPNIARVFDGGTTEGEPGGRNPGRPYFVMELVKGVPITKYCDEHRLTPKERLELFAQACQAVQHAHQKGVIHRDLKPSNVLVAPYDGRPVVKVIDFGVAKAAGQRLTEKTLFTAFGAVVGTLEYMSPEQAELNNQDIDTRSDVYSLGVLLYELLTGTTPLTRDRLKLTAFTDMLRAVREEEPPKPSTRLAQSTETLPAVSAQRHMEPAKLTRLVRGELDWIVMKALEKDRARRYETANNFAHDIQRYLTDEPVQACPPTAGYRLRKFARRNKRALATASLLSAVVVLAVPALAVSYVRTSRALAHETQATQDRQLALDREKQANEDLELTAYIQRVELAGRELAVGNVGHAEELLEECPEHLRDWEWHFLKRQRYEDPLSIPHSETVVRVAFSPDGGQIASVCIDGTFAIRDAQNGKVLHTLESQLLPGRAAAVRGLAFSPDGRYLALARQDGKVRVWDAIRGQSLHALDGHKGAAWQVAFSPDSRMLASGGDDGKVRLWDMATGHPLRQFTGHPTGVKSVAFRPDGMSVLAACDDGTVKVWDSGSGHETFSFPAELAFPSRTWFSPDARRLARTSMDGVIKVWDTTTGGLEINRQSMLHPWRAVAFHPDGKRIALAGFDGNLRILDAAGGNEMLTIFAHSSLIADAVFSPDGNKIASASYDHTIKIWDSTPLQGDPLAASCVTLTGHTKLVTGVAYSPDSRWLASSSWDGTVKVWESLRHAERDRADAHHAERDGYALRYTLRGHSGNVRCVAFSSDNRTLASGSLDRTVKLWDLQVPVGDSLSVRPIDCGQRVNSIAFRPDGRLLAVGLESGIALYDSATGKLFAPFQSTPAPVPALDFTPDSRHLISSGASDAALRAWDGAGEKQLFEIWHYSMPNSSVAVSPNGRLVASPAHEQGAAEPAVFVWEVDWDAKTYKNPPVHKLKGHKRYVYKVAFSPDGRHLASGSWDATIKIWDVKTGKELRTLRGHAGTIYGLAFSPDGRSLAACSGSATHGEVKVWDAASWDEKLRAERQAQRDQAPPEGGGQ